MLHYNPVHVTVTDGSILLLPLWDLRLKFPQKMMLLSSR